MITKLKKSPFTFFRDISVFFKVDRPLDLQAHIIQMKGLHDIIIYPFFHGIDCAFNPRESRYQEEKNFAVLVLDPLRNNRGRLSPA